MSTEQADRASAVVFNVPNQLTSLRLVLAVAMFCLIPWGDQCRWFYVAGTVLFVLAAGTDWLDGWYARKYGQVTVLGRILDPFADKVIICGTFIYLAALPRITDVPWGLHAWMVVVIVARELLVTVLRGFFEQRGSDFSAKMSGKLKMTLQCVAATACLVYLSWSDEPPAWLQWSMVAAVWGAVVLTVYSGAVYVMAAVKLLQAGLPSDGGE